MKVYVDELPKCCQKCPYCDTKYGRCDLSGSRVEYFGCHALTPLSNYTKQVRKEVLQEVKVALREKIRLMQSDEHCYPENAIDWHTIVDTIKQIQGE